MLNYNKVCNEKFDLCTTLNEYFITFKMFNYNIVFQDKYRNDVNLAIQLLQCKPSNFIGQKYDTVSGNKLLLIITLNLI